MHLKVIKRNAIHPIITGYIAIWDSVDCYETYFDRDRPPDFGLGDKLQFLPVRLMYQHAGDKKVRYAIIGEIYRIGVNDTGVWFEAKLYRNKWLPGILREIEDGKLATSSASAAHLANFDEDGRFDKWFLTEVSLTDDPCEYNMPKVQIIRSGTTLQLLSHEGEAWTRTCPCGCGKKQQSPVLPEDASTHSDSIPSILESEKMDASELAKLLRALSDFGVPDDANRLDLLTALIEEQGVDFVMEVINQMTPPVAVPEPPLMTTPGMSSDLAGALAKLLLKSNSTPPAVASQPNPELEALKQQLTDTRAALDAIQKQPPVEEPPTVARQAPAAIPDLRRFSKLAGKSFGELTAIWQFARTLRRGTANRETPFPADLSETFYYVLVNEAVQARDKNMRAASGIPFTRAVTRADEVMNTGQTGYGAEWIGEAFSTDLWMKVRDELRLYQLLVDKGMVVKQVPKGYNKMTIPIEGADPTVYVVAEATDVTSDTQRPIPGLKVSKAGTGEASITLRKMGAAVWYTGEMDEDSLVDMASTMREKLITTMRERMEYALINGDMTTGNSPSGNINYYDGAVTADATTKSLPYWTVCDGFFHLPLVTNTANAYDAANALGENLFLTLLSMMGTSGTLSNARDRILYLVDTQTRDATITLPAFKSAANVGGAFTLISGTLPQIWGVDAYSGGQIPLADDNGKISATPSNNTFGRIGAIRPDQWAFGNKRDITTELERDALSDTFLIVTMTRWGLTYMDVEAAALAYEVNTALSTA